MIKWRDEYNTGVENLDAQHRRLFEIANEAYGLLRDELRVDKYDDIVAILDELREYTKYHFQTEEDYMLSIGYKKFLSHKAEHAEFIAKIEAVDLDKVDASQDEYLRVTLDFVCTWITEHILGRDKLYATP
ncbi:bacteriohemerythrin [Anaeroselena agilis]|uniref:Hemerythrin family protein n=1 Tax=Anaeroselena agilis TaxID=3063788 RepID=A0ABU3P3N5_9FIRM|nr:hemerythrin family protein [Selenomonadales bacterium 4137-cl]